MTRILGYADRVSAAPGEAVQVMVSCDGIETYDAELVRVIQGDINPAGPGFREEVVPHDLGGPFKGRYQPIHTGSYGVVHDNPAFQGLTSLGLFAALWPTMPGPGPQCIVSRKDPVSGAGFRLAVDAEGTLVFELRSTDGTGAIVSTGKQLIAERWYLVAAGYDAGTGVLTVGQRPLSPYPKVDDEGFISVSTTPGLGQDGVTASLMIGAESAEDRPAKHHFNGRIESPQLWSRPLTETEIQEQLDVNYTRQDHGDLVAAWDFSIGIPTDRITDLSANRLHGRLVNLPTRGVAGHKWNGEEHNWTKRPEHYGAIHFHDDDLYDCDWKADFSLIAPENLRSGVYALRLYTDREEYYVPLAVRPPRGAVTAPVAFLLPTASYLAYANNRIGIDAPETEIVIGRLIQMNKIDLFMQEHPELGLCFYDLHNDGSGVYYSSRLRPVVNMQTKNIGHLGGIGSNLWQFNADTHILGWLEQLDQPFDVVTDEDLETEGLAAISGYRTVITGTHPEYYSARMLDALQAHVNGGGRLMYLGGNGFYWRISWHPDLPGVIECRKSEDGIRAFVPRPGEFYASFTGEYTGLWRRNGRPPNELTGVGMVSQGFDVSSPYVRSEASRDPRAAFIFEGVEDDIIGDFGLSGGGAAGLELDGADPALGTPPHTLVLASSERHTDLYLMTPEDMNDPVPGLGGTEAEIIRSDMVFFEAPKGGAVFSAGSIAWAGSLSHNDYDNNVARITTNVLRRFIEDTPF
jgi:N,N-dimethylformamidase